jgi:hypothetical protein
MDFQARYITQLAVEIAFVLGDIETDKSHSKEVLLSADFTPEEVLAVNVTILKTLSSVQSIR